MGMDKNGTQPLNKTIADASTPSLCIGIIAILEGEDPPDNWFRIRREINRRVWELLENE